MQIIINSQLLPHSLNFLLALEKNTTTPAEDTNPHNPRHEKGTRTFQVTLKRHKPTSESTLDVPPCCYYTVCLFNTSGTGTVSYPNCCTALEEEFWPNNCIVFHLSLWKYYKHAYGWSVVLIFPLHYQFIEGERWKHTTEWKIQNPGARTYQRKWKLKGRLL